MGFNFVETDKIRKNKSQEVARTYLIIINTLEVQKKKKRKRKSTCAKIVSSTASFVENIVNWVNQIRRMVIIIKIMVSWLDGKETIEFQMLLSINHFNKLLGQRISTIHNNVPLHLTDLTI